MRKPFAIALVVLAIAAGCGDDDDAASPGATTSTVAGQPPGATTPPVTNDSGDTVVPADTATAAPAPNDATEQPPDGTGAPGSFAPAYLRAATGDQLLVEVAAQDGAAPGQATLDHLADALGRASGKSVRVAGARTPPANDQWTSDSLRAAVGAIAASPQGDGLVVLRLLFVHGHWAEDDSVLGVAFQADAAAIFVDDVRAASDPLVAPGAIEIATTTHEVGHLLGLVDLVLDTGREDPEHPGHSSNQRSVMYWAVESSLVTDLLTGGPPRDFDAADDADLATIKNG